MILELIKKYSLIEYKNLNDLEEYLSSHNNINLYDIVSKKKPALNDLKSFINRHDPTRQRMFQLVYDNNFLPMNCLQWIENNHQHIHTHNKIHIVDNRPIHPTLIKHVLKIVKWIASIANKSPDIEVWIFLCPFKKEFPMKKGSVLGRNEVNSGVTLLSPREKWIQIFRAEEVLKVLIHELLHYYQLDMYHEAKELQDELGIDHLLNEAYNELCAIYIHTFYYSKVYKRDFQECLQEEMEYSKRVFYRVVDYYQIKDWKQFFGDFKQRTNVFSYYILKYILMQHWGLLNTPNKRNMVLIKEIITEVITNYTLKTEPSDSGTSLRMSHLEITWPS
jgi:hypothetical protein